MNGSIIPLGQVPISKAMAEWEAKFPKVLATCYVCGETYETYASLRTSPPYAQMVRTVDQITPVDTCLKPECMRREIMRQDALYSFLLRGTLDRGEDRRAAELAAEKKRRMGDPR